MAVRKIILIDENKCNGCGLCVPNCVEGAIQIIDGKAKLVKDEYCDGLGACLGHCPQDALNVIEREAPDFDEEAAMAHAHHTVPDKHQHHNEHHDEHHEVSKHSMATEKDEHHHHSGGCPGSKVMRLDRDNCNSAAETVSSVDVEIKIKPQLRQWPVQLNLVPVNAPYFNNADLLVTADCVPFAYPDYHLGLLKGKIVVIGCPKLDDIEHYIDKLTQIVTNNDLKSITVAFMEVPCCMGIVRAVNTAVANSRKNIPVHLIRIGIDGSRTNL